MNDAAPTTDTPIADATRPDTRQTCRTHLTSILAAPWKCGPCGKEGLVFDPHKLKALKERGEAFMECPSCKAALTLFIPKILTPNAPATGPVTL